MNVIIGWRRDDKCSNYILIKYTADDTENTEKICGQDDLYGNIAIRSNNVWIKYHVKVIFDLNQYKNFISSSFDRKLSSLSTTFGKASSIIEGGVYIFMYSFSQNEFTEDR